MSLKYNLNDTPPVTPSIVYAFQWFAFNIVNISVIPLIVGNAFGLDGVETAQLAQRTSFYVALASLLQVLFGHKLPIIEGPAGMWWGVFVTLASMAPAMGKDLAVLRTDLELGVIIAGVISLVLGLTGMFSRMLKLFTPPVTGSVLVLLSLQLTGPFLSGMLGITPEHPTINPMAVLVSCLVITVICAVNLRARGFFRSIAILIGTAVGWIAALALGLSHLPAWSNTPLVAPPGMLSWGTPTYDTGIVLISVLTGLLVISNLVASVLAMERTLAIKLPAKAYNRGMTFNGIADILAGLGSTIGFVSYSASAGLVALTGVGSRLPFIIFTVIMLILGWMPPVAHFLTAIPAPVGYSVLLTSFCQMLGFGLKDFAALKLTGRQFFVIGLPIMVGTGLFNLPTNALLSLPVILRQIIGNGFITGMLLCLLLEHVLLPQKYFGE